MALVLDDRVMESTTTTGTGTLTLNGAVSGFQSFAAVGDANTCYYSVEDVDADGNPDGDWETGIGTFTSAGTTLSRDTVLASSNSDSAVNFGAGTKRVFITIPESRAVHRETPLGDTIANFKLEASVAANALTISLKTQDGGDASDTDPIIVPFRSATAATGGLTIRKATAADSLVVSSGSTLNTTAGEAFRLWIVLLDNAGTLELGVVHRNHAFGLVDHGIYSASAEGGAGGADSSGVIYAASAVTSKPIRLLGYMEWSSGLSTPGTWDAGPDKIQEFGPGIPPPGSVVQIVSASTNTPASTTTTIPDDDTKPQNTEGAALSDLDLAITPQANANLLIAEHSAWYAANNTVGLTVALFQDSDADALNLGYCVIVANNREQQLHLLHSMLAGTTSETTLKFRFGPSANTGYFIRRSGGDNFGDAAYGTSRVVEYQA